MRGKMKLRYLSVVAALALALGPLAPAAALELPQSSLVPGGVLVQPLPGAADQAPVATFEGKRAMVLRDGERWVAIVGIPLSFEPGRATLHIRSGSSPESTIDFEVKDKQYVTQSLKVAPVTKAELSSSRSVAERANLTVYFPAVTLHLC